jgi:cellulose 1,4-beta-cellobiosidase
VALSWAASSGTVTNYQIERATGASSTNFTQIGTSTTTSFTDNTVAANTSYRYRIRAVNSAGNSPYTSPIVVSVGSCTAQVPGTPGTLTVTGTPTSATLSWGASSGTVTNYQVERAVGASSTTFTQIGTSTTTSFTDTGLTAGTVYRYRVRATNSAGASPYSNIVNFGVIVDPPPGGCTATFTNVNQWPGGFQGAVTVTNTGTNNTTSWTVVLTFANGQQIYQLWGGQATLGSNPIVIRSEPWNANLAPNASTSVGFLATWNGSNPAPTLTCSRTP